MDYHEHLCHDCGAVIFCTRGWNCTLTDFDALCTKCQHDEEAQDGQANGR